MDFVKSGTYLKEQRKKRIKERKELKKEKN
jgi:hypothetical protein